MAPSRLTRRELLERAGRLAAAGIFVPLGAELASAQTQPAEPVSMAMHVHASFSEGPASMEGQLAQAAKHGVDVLWWTEHDWRMSAHRYRDSLHFTEALETVQGRFEWFAEDVGRLTSSSEGSLEFGAFPNSPADPAPGGSLRLMAVGSGSSFALRRFRGDMGFRQNTRASLAGQRLDIEVLPVKIGRDAYLEIEVTTSRRPAKAGRADEKYVLSYRIGGPGAPNSRVANGTLGIVTLPATPGAWNAYSLNPAYDLGVVWPGVLGRDASLVSIAVSAASRNGVTAEGNFDYLRFVRNSVSGDAPLQVQRDLMQAYAPKFRAVKQYQGLEISLYEPHIAWYGGQLALPDYGDERLSPGPPAEGVIQQQVDTIHAGGGLASYTHPFGTGAPVLTDSEQEALRSALAAELVGNRAYGCDLLEVGFRLRAGVTLERLAMVWDTLSRNAIFTTGIGTSDNHESNDWMTQAHNFMTWAWAKGPLEVDLMTALRQGRVFFGDPAKFSGTLDIAVDSTRPMGSVSLSTKAARWLKIIATGVPSGGAVRVIQGAVDYAGPGQPDPATIRLSTLPASGAITKTVSLDNKRESYVRVVVLDRSRTQVALSNPIWLLRDEPVGGIPLHRRA